MRRKMLNASQLQQEVNRRIHRLQEIVEDGVKIRVPRPQLQQPDKTGCNWNMTHFGNAVGFERDIGRSTGVDSAMKQNLTNLGEGRTVI